ncbi:MAG: type II toxin-antitoxin system RelE/ParE family toxin [bacterium]|nr:type II toxin-antitoxin system RelE/ParE family toxin [bacterium]MDE0416445.1 type II toxin-antitoxin system RelE/ParE family toxin [bacterium]
MSTAHGRRGVSSEGRIARFHAFSAQAARRLVELDSAAGPRDLDMLRSNRLEASGGDRAGQYSIRINVQWRICFRWADDGPYDAAIEDYPPGRWT